jgi:hypothetical protein
VSWHQTTDDVLIKVPVPPGTRGKDVAFEVHPTRLSLAVQGEPLLAGGLADAGAIKLDGASAAGVGRVLALSLVCGGVADVVCGARMQPTEKPSPLPPTHAPPPPPPHTHTNPRTPPRLLLGAGGGRGQRRQGRAHHARQGSDGL